MPVEHDWTSIHVDRGTITPNDSVQHCRILTHPEGRPRPSQVGTFLRHVAHTFFTIPAGHEDLLAWSSHSIRVQPKSFHNETGFRTPATRIACGCAATPSSRTCATHYARQKHAPQPLASTLPHRSSEDRTNNTNPTRHRRSPAPYRLRFRNTRIRLYNT